MAIEHKATKEAFEIERERADKLHSLEDVHLRGHLVNVELQEAEMALCRVVEEKKRLVALQEELCTQETELRQRIAQLVKDGRVVDMQFEKQRVEAGVVESSPTLDRARQDGYWLSTRNKPSHAPAAPYLAATPYTVPGGPPDVLGSEYAKIGDFYPPRPVSSITSTPGKLVIPGVASTHVTSVLSGYGAPVYKSAASSWDNDWRRYL